MHGGSDLLEVSTRNPGEFARTSLKMLFKLDEVQSSLLQP